MAIKIVGIAGSLRRSSYNKALLRAASGLVPEDVVMEILEIGLVPPFNEDTERAGMPEVVSDLRKKIEKSDGIIFATPEYNHSIPGVLKNAIDWLSRGDDRPLSNKPAAVIGASMGTIGTARAQVHFRDVAAALNMPVMLQPEVLVSKAHEKFDDSLVLIDDATEKHLSRFLVAFRKWVLSMKKT